MNWKQDAATWLLMAAPMFAIWLIAHSLPIIVLALVACGASYIRGYLISADVHVPGRDCL